MKKFLIGCGIVVLVLVAIAIGTLVYATLKFRSFTASAQATITSFDSLNQKYPWTEPATADLDPERLDAWFDVRVALLDEMAKDADFQALSKIFTDPAGTPQTGVFGLMMKAPGLLVKTGDAIVRVLDEKKISPMEYRWITRVVYAALREGADNKDKEFMDANLEIMTRLTAISAGAGAGNPGMSQAIATFTTGSDPVRGILAPDAVDNLRPHLSLLRSQRLELFDVLVMQLSGSVSKTGQVNFKLGGVSGSVNSTGAEATTGSAGK